MLRITHLVSRNEGVLRCKVASLACAWQNGGDALYVSIKSDENNARTPPGRVVGTDDSRFLALLSFGRCLFKLGRTPSSDDHAPRMLTWTRPGTVTDRSTETNLHITCGAW